MRGRLAARDKRVVHLRAVSHNSDNDYNEPRPVYADAVPIRASVQPVSDRLTAEQYGQRATGMRAMYFGGNEPIKKGDGVCVDVPGDQYPDYTVAGIADWHGMRRIDIELVPLELRKDGEDVAD